MLQHYKGWELQGVSSGLFGGHFVYWYQPRFVERILGFPKQNREIVQKIYINYSHKELPSSSKVMQVIDELHLVALKEGVASKDISGQARIKGADLLSEYTSL